MSKATTLYYYDKTPKHPKKTAGTAMYAKKIISSAMYNFCSVTDFLNLSYTYYEM